MNLPNLTVMQSLKLGQDNIIVISQYPKSKMIVSNHNNDIYIAQP